MDINIFINYRREEAQAAAGRLYDLLENEFGRERIFFDVDSIMPGKDFAEELSGRVAECDIFLSVVGKGWLDVKDHKGERRIDNPTDWVRIEIESALQHKKHVIPVLVDGAEMPSPDDLPDSLAAFTRRNAVRLTHDRFRADVQGLVGAVCKLREAWAREETEKQRRHAEQEEASRRRAAEEEERRKAEQALRESERAEAERKALVLRQEEEDRLRWAEVEAARCAAQEEERRKAAEAEASRVKEERHEAAEAEACRVDEKRGKAEEPAPVMLIQLEPESVSAMTPSKPNASKIVAIVAMIVLAATGGGLWMMAQGNSTRPLSPSDTGHDRGVAKDESEVANRPGTTSNQSASPTIAREPSNGPSAPEDKSLGKPAPPNIVQPLNEESQKPAETPRRWIDPNADRQDVERLAEQNRREREQIAAEHEELQRLLAARRKATGGEAKRLDAAIRELDRREVERLAAQARH
jgi:hypothetical protein